MTAILALVLGITLSTGVAFAQETPVVEPVTETATVVVALTPDQQMQAELAELKIKEADPATGLVARFFLRLKIKEIENKLNIATAFK